MTDMVRRPLLFAVLVIALTACGRAGTPESGGARPARIAEFYRDSRYRIDVDRGPQERRHRPRAALDWPARHRMEMIEIVRRRLLMAVLVIAPLIPDLQREAATKWAAILAGADPAPVTQADARVS